MMFCLFDTNLTTDERRDNFYNQDKSLENTKRNIRVHGK